MVLRRWALPLMWAHSVHSSAPKPPSLRLFSQNPLFASARLSPPDGQRHYLFSVMRAREGDRVALFNGIDGEWEAEIVRLNRKGCEFAVRGCLRPQPAPAPAPTLLFGVLKGARLPSLVEKAVELGVGELVPVLTTHCHARALNVPRLQAVATEAAEQCGRLDVPVISPLATLRDVLATWDPQRPLFACDTRTGASPLAGQSAAAARAGGILIGPEGGLAPHEWEALDTYGYVTPVSLGRNTLRAETAAMAALAILGAATEDAV